MDGNRQSSGCTKGNLIHKRERREKNSQQQHADRNEYDVCAHLSLKQIRARACLAFIKTQTQKTMPNIMCSTKPNGRHTHRKYAIRNAKRKILYRT